MATRIPLTVLNPDYPGSENGQPAGGALRTRQEGGDIMEEIKKEVSENPIMLYMKGSPDAPQCGFSMRVVQILAHVGVESYAYANILIDPEKREAIKEFSEWPTIPQLYINGEFVGGADIVTEMFQSGELKTALGIEG